MSQDLAAEMKAGMRRMVQAVSVLASRDSSGKDYAMTVSSVTSVSDSPASLLVCVNTQTSICPVLTLGAKFSINVLSRNQEAVSNTCATGKQSEARFDVGEWDRSSGPVPFLKGAQAQFFCEVSSITAHGTHNVIVGNIVKVWTDTSSQPSPLAYLDGGYHSVS